MSFGDGCRVLGDAAFCSGAGRSAGADACASFGSSAIASCTNIIVSGDDLDGNVMQLFERK